LLNPLPWWERVRVRGVINILFYSNCKRNSTSYFASGRASDCMIVLPAITSFRLLPSHAIP
jgi:hypothetical protein